MGTDCMAGLWAALLHERRVAIIASKPSRLSACVQAANATLFPMSWQHIFIPILPRHLVDYLLAPMPFLIGVPRAVMEVSFLCLCNCFLAYVVFSLTVKLFRLLLIKTNIIYSSIYRKSFFIEQKIIRLS